MLLESIKACLRRTTPYRWLKFYRGRKRLLDWTVDDEALRRFYSQFLAPGDLCFDVGANIGLRTKVFLSLGAAVVAVEPQAECRSIMKSAMGDRVHLTVVEQALGAHRGQARFFRSQADTVSSLCQQWIATVKNSGRFPGVSWDTHDSMELTTLDNLIHAHGIPAFVKIDVEGYEDEVIKGLSCPLRVMSLELTPEFPGPIFRSLDMLEKLGDIRINYAVGENPKLELSEWVRTTEARKIIEGVGSEMMFGDIYVRFVNM